MVLQANSQIVFWSENFNNGCTDNCPANSYNSVNGTWTVQDINTQGNVANEWFVSCAENGEPVGQCGASCGNNATLHIANTPCTLCFACPNGDCGAAYNGGPTFGGEDPTTNKRVVSPLINTLGKTAITLTFKYIERGQTAADDFYLEYSINNGLTWTSLLNPAKTANTCGGGQGLWTLLNAPLPGVCENISNLQLGLVWKNNSDGIGSDPSVAIDDLQLASNNTTPPIADFNCSLINFCDSTCIGYIDGSINNPTSWKWIFEGGTPDTVYTQNALNICYNTPGTYDVTLIASNAAGVDTIVRIDWVTVNACHIPAVSFTASDTMLCEKSCINFFDQSTNNPTQWSWHFPGATPPDTISTLQNPTNICYNLYGAYMVKLVATNATGSDSATYTSYILVNQNPPQPVISQNGSVLVCTQAQGYQWFYNSIPLAGQTNQVLFSPTSGNYFVIITDSNGCNTVSNLITVTGFKEVLNNEWLQCYPNPVKDQLVLSFNKEIKNDKVEITITDVTGRKIKQITQNGINLNRVINLDLNQISNGIYIIKIFVDDLIFTSKFIKG